MHHEKRINRWYFGGIAATSAATCTHPLDLLKTIIQTPDPKAAAKVIQGRACYASLQASCMHSIIYADKCNAFIAYKVPQASFSITRVSEPKVRIGMLHQTIMIVRTQGVGALYKGLSASMLRQMFHSTTRYGIYEVLKQKKCPNGEKMSLLERIAIATFSGTCGGIVGTPPDVVKIRMQNDVKLPVEQRRNYKNVIDGLVCIFREEGFTKLFRGWEWAAQRTAVVTVGQIAFYDATKEQLLQTTFFQDNVITHFTASIVAGTVATILSQPIDVCKTLAMNAKTGDYAGPLHLYKETAKQGYMVFTKGFVPSFVRLGPQTILTWIFLEQFRLHFGQRVPIKHAEVQSHSGQDKLMLLQDKVMTLRA